MTHGSLFSGIGGFDLAAEWMGWENVFHCEWNEFGQKVLKYYWPNAKLYGNIKEADFTEWRGKVDIVSGGFPCQPYSLAGKRKGKEDERHLWPEMLRAIREIQPRWVVGENVLGLVNWSGGLVFHEVQTDLEAAGYEVWPYVLPACGVNAPHRRDRVWFVGHRNNNGQHRCDSKDEINTGEGGEYALGDIVNGLDNADASDTCCPRLQITTRRKQREIQIEDESFERCKSGRTLTARTGWEIFPTQPPVCSGNDGFSPELDGITVSKHRKESLMAYGNAVVPQVVYQIFKAIEQYGTENRTT